MYVRNNRLIDVLKRNGNAGPSWVDGVYVSIFGSLLFKRETTRLPSVEMRNIQTPIIKQSEHGIYHPPPSSVEAGTQYI
jgi:hypothetical protein